MASLIVHLTDAHCDSKHNPLADRAESISNCILSHCEANTTVFFAITGDIANKGGESEFAAGTDILTSVIGAVSAKGMHVETLVVPGNHDLDLSEDQTARDVLIASLSAGLPAASVQSVVLKPLSNYFAFQNTLASTPNSLTPESPFFARHTFVVGPHSIQFNLLNTAWSCRRKDSPGSLRFPVDQIDIGDTSNVTYVVTLMHHPFNWLAQPDSMRPVRDKIEKSSDLVYFGHEHVPDDYTKSADFVVEAIHGGVLQESPDNGTSVFTLTSLDFDANTTRRFEYSWSKDSHAFVRTSVDDRSITRNINRTSDSLALQERFSNWLDDIGLPITPSSATSTTPTKSGDLHLSDLFTHPDLREYDPRHPTGQYKRIHGDNARESLTGKDRVLVTGFEKSGKTSLAKRLFQDHRQSGLVPLLLTSNAFSKVQNFNALIAACEKCVTHQYRALKPEAFWQLPTSNRVLIVDDIHELLPKLSDKDAISDLLARFGKIVFLGESELSIAELRSRENDALLFGFHRYHICEFGHVLLQSLTRRWLHFTRPDIEVDIEDDELHRICAAVEKVLSLDAIPHQPWVLLVLIQQADTNDEVAAKNGSYGHLFECIVTATLARSTYTGLDIRSKYTYLAECAHYMFHRHQSSLDESQAKEFHEAHTQKYDISVNFEAIMKDLDSVGLIRRDEGEIYFRTKYSFCFFVAWYFSQHLHHQETRTELGKICQEIHNADIANIVVFLAHLSSDPIVLEMVKRAADGSFGATTPALLTNDLGPIATYSHAEFLKLVEIPPEEHREEIAHVRDERLARREVKELDGRSIQLADSAETAETEKSDNVRTFKAVLSEVRTCIKSIQILGQILRNGAGAIPGGMKQEIVSSVFLAARRLLGHLFERLPSEIPTWAAQLATRYRDEMPIRSEESSHQYEQEIATKVGRHIYQTAWYTTYSVIMHVADSCGLEILDNTFRKVVESDVNTPNQLFQMAIKLDRSGKLPKEEAIAFYRQLSDQTFCRSILKGLVIRHLQMYKVKPELKQSIAQRMDIDIIHDRSSLDQTRKRIGNN